MMEGALHPAPIVGRDRELSTLSRGLESTLAGHGQFFLVSGEPGVGKTRLLEEMARLAELNGALIAWGRCWEGEDAPPFWPWVQILRTLRQSDGAAAVVAQDRHIAAAIDRLLSGSGRNTSEGSGVVAGAENSPFARESDEQFERFALLDGISMFIGQVATLRPLVLLIDDIHAAHLPSLLLLELLARDVGRGRLLVVAAHRDGAGRVLATRMSELARLSTAVPLRGLDFDAVRSFVTSVAQREPSEALLNFLHETTGGNPFFLDEVVRLLLAEGRFDDVSFRATRLGVPERVRSAVTARLAPLPAESRRMLEVAAMVGQEFDAEMVVAVVGVAIHELDRALASVLAAGFLQPVAPHSLRFSHALIREAIYDAIPMASRLHLHKLIADALEGRGSGSSGATVSMLAHHFLRGQPHTDAAKALRYTRQAAERALELYAYEVALEYFEQALALMDRGVPHGSSERAEVLLAVALAAECAGDMARAKQAVSLASVEARRVRSATLLADAALALRAPADGVKPDLERINLLEAATAAVGPEDPSRRARLLARLACELSPRTDVERRDSLSGEAVALARQLGNGATLAFALAGRCSVLSGLDHQTRLPLATELLGLAYELDDRELALEAHRWRVIDLLTSCDLAEVDREIESATRLAEQLRQPYYLWWPAIWRAARAILVGRFADGERLAAEAHAIGQSVRPQDASTVLSSHMWQVLWLRGNFELILPMVEAFRAQSETAYPEISFALAAAYVGANRFDDARREFETLAAGDFAVPGQHSAEWLLSLTSAAQVCAALGDAERADVLYALLRPFGDRAIITPKGLGCYGPVDRSLGLLASVRGDWDQAESHFRSSFELSRRLAAPPFIAMTQLNHAAMLWARGDTADLPRALTLVTSALTTAQSLGMGKIVEDAEQLRTRLGAAAPIRSTNEEVQFETNSMSDEGEYWTFRYRGSVCRVRDRVGLAYLALLLERPHEELAALTLVTAPNLEPLAVELGSAERGSWSDDFGDVLDPRARKAYRERLAELASELKEAEQANDVGRVELLRGEREALSSTLGNALGLGGRGRRTGSPSERARVRVTRAIREAIERVRAAHGTLGEHLARSIRTGTYCCYAPAQPTQWSVTRR